ncbi:MAG: AI-2E family transporter [Deltaproteobacteria bacterium]|nr:AI-2E family transporter [Deltaproteobacteria bacterium]
MSTDETTCAPERSVPWMAILASIAALVVMWPLVTWILLAVWTSVFVRPLHARVAHALGDRPRVAAWLVVIFIVVLFVPIALVATGLTLDAIELVRRFISSEQVQSLVTGDDSVGRSPRDLMQLVVGQSGRALTLAAEVAGTAARLVMGLVVLFGGLYTLLIQGGRLYAWLEQHVPLPTPAFRRLAGAFVETGRGLFIGTLGAGLAQAGVATILFLALGVPQAFALGLLVLAASVLHLIGTFIVWGPVAIGLFAEGRTTAGLILLAGGVFVISSIDNFVRPYLARRGQLQLPTLLVLVAIFGGLQVFGAKGVLLGPLLLRLAKEGLAIWREARQSEPARC